MKNHNFNSVGHNGICFFFHLHLPLGYAGQQLVQALRYKLEVAGSIPDGVNVIFHWHNPSDRTMALGFTQPLTEMSTRNVFWGLKRPVCRADKLTTFMCRLSWNLGASASWNPQGLSRPVMGLLYLYLPDWLWVLTTQPPIQWTYEGQSQSSRNCGIAL